jgi:hypothetical protein
LIDLTEEHMAAFNKVASRDAFSCSASSSGVGNKENVVVASAVNRNAASSSSGVGTKGSQKRTADSMNKGNEQRKSGRPVKAKRFD